MFKTTERTMEVMTIVNITVIITGAAPLIVCKAGDGNAT